MHRILGWMLVSITIWYARLAPAQLDPVPRQLLQFGYNAAFQGHAPLSAYAFYYRNQPNFPRTNMTLRLALAPTYLDTELGFRQLLGDDTDFGIGVAGGGFADSYDEIRGGVFRPRESFLGHGGEINASVYHCFNPDDRIPLNGILRVAAHFTVFDRESSTADDFELPDDRAEFTLRAGLRWGGKEPLLFPSLAMELSVWYEGQYRTGAGSFGGVSYGARSVQEHSHLFWEQALLAYTFPESKQGLYLSLTAGTSLNADRFSAYRLGALLPLVSEFPLSLPGYYYQEISARHFILLGGNYIVPLDVERHWNLNFSATTAGVDYLPDLKQPGSWHSGVGFGLLYQSSSLKVMLGYAYGVDAIRTDGRGAHSIGVLMQMDLDHARELLFDPQQPTRWRGFQRIFGAFGG